MSSEIQAYMEQNYRNRTTGTGGRWGGWAGAVKGIYRAQGRLQHWDVRADMRSCRFHKR